MSNVSAQSLQISRNKDTSAFDIKDLQIFDSYVSDPKSTTVLPDPNRPIITLKGDDELIIVLNTSYVDEGATASDNKGGDLTSSIAVTNNVDTSTVGTYYVKYNVTDAAGNAAVEVVRTVT